MNFNYKKNIAGFTPLNKIFCKIKSYKSIAADDLKRLTGVANLTGLTLIEIMVVMGISMIFIIISSDFITQGFRASTFIYEQDIAVQNTRRAQNIMVKEIRKANQAENCEYLLDTVLPQSFIFYSDTDADGLTERVRYFLDNHDLKRGLIHATGSPLSYPINNETASILTSYINNQASPIFLYYDKDNALINDPTANKQSIRLIEISAKIDVSPERAPLDVIIEANVQIRNLKDNL